MTIEHLASQSAGGEHVGQLGNLIYASETLNSRLRDKSFSAKRKTLTEVNSEWIPPEVLAATKWGSAEIEVRTRSMAVVARTRVWR